jgi:DNA-binding cell septation regulator SpoVG
MFSYDFSFSPLPNSTGSMVAYADLIIEGTLKIKGFKIMKGQNNELWVAAPSEKSNKVDDSGKAVYYPTIWWVDAKASDDAKRTAVETEVYAEMVKAFEASQKGNARQSAAAAHTNQNAAQAPTTKKPALLW